MEEGWLVMKVKQGREPSDDAEVGQFILSCVRAGNRGTVYRDWENQCNENLLEIYINNSNAFFNS